MRNYHRSLSTAFRNMHLVLRTTATRAFLAPIHFTRRAPGLQGREPLHLGSAGDDNPRALLEKDADADMLREMIGFAAQRLMELEIGTLTGAVRDERSSERINQRNGYRDRRPSQTWGRSWCQLK